MSETWPPPIAPPGVRPPPNPYRAEVSAREVVYHRPPSARVALRVAALFCVTLSILSLGFALLDLGLISIPGMHIREDPAFVLLMGVGVVLFTCGVPLILAMTGPRVLRVSPSEGTYIYQISLPLRRPATMDYIVGVANRDELGLPWRVTEYRGGVEDMAGIQMRETTRKSITTYWLFLRWRNPILPSLRVGQTVSENKARALQVQAAEDLGVPVLPDATD